MAPTVESNPLTSLGFRLVTKVSLISNFRSSRDLHLFSIAVGASQSAANDWKACSTSGAFLFGEWYATRSTNTSFSNRTHLNYRKNPGNIFRTGSSGAVSKNWAAGDSNPNLPLHQSIRVECTDGGGSSSNKLATPQQRFYNIGSIPITQAEVTFEHRQKGLFQSFRIIKPL